MSCFEINHFQKKKSKYNLAQQWNVVSLFDHMDGAVKYKLKRGSESSERFCETSNLFYRTSILIHVFLTKISDFLAHLYPPSLFPSSTPFNFFNLRHLFRWFIKYFSIFCFSIFADFFFFFLNNLQALLLYLHFTVI